MEKMLYYTRGKNGDVSSRFDSFHLFAKENTSNLELKFSIFVPCLTNNYFSALPQLAFYTRYCLVIF